MTVGTRFSDITIKEVLARVERFNHRPFVMVLDGPGGSGRSTLARELAEGFRGSVAIVQGDDFYADLDDDYRMNLDAEGGYRDYFDWNRLREQVLVPARGGRSIEFQRYDWVNARMGDWFTVDSVNLLIIEGVYSSRPELRDLADLVLWVKTSTSERLRRQVERGENDSAWIQRWMAAENYYIDNVHAAAPDDIEIVGE